MTKISQDNNLNNMLMSTKGNGYGDYKALEIDGPSGLLVLIHWQRTYHKKSQILQPSVQFASVLSMSVLSAVKSMTKNLETGMLNMSVN